MPWQETPQTLVTFRASRQAKALRRTATEAEKRLWWHLRNRLPMAGTHFRRQVPIGPYIADFCCLAHRLIIEVDGEQHGLGANLTRDRERDAFLAAQGFRVLRFSNRTVLREIDSVLDTIFAALQPAAFPAGDPTPTPSPSLQGGGA